MQIMWQCRASAPHALNKRALKPKAIAVLHEDTHVRDEEPLQETRGRRPCVGRTVFVLESLDAICLLVAAIHLGPGHVVHPVLDAGSPITMLRLTEGSNHKTQPRGVSHLHPIKELRAARGAADSHGPGGLGLNTALLPGMASWALWCSRTSRSSCVNPTTCSMRGNPVLERRGTTTAP